MISICLGMRLSSWFESQKGSRGCAQEARRRSQSTAKERPARDTGQRGSSGVLCFFDELDGLADRLDLLGGIIRDVDIELLFQFHDQFDRVERVGS